jgi:FO synthase subunit 1
MPEEHSEFREWIEDIGYSSIIDYLPHLCEIAIDYGLLPHSNPGVMDSRDISRLKPLNASGGLMAESTRSMRL